MSFFETLQKDDLLTLVIGQKRDVPVTVKSIDGDSIVLIPRGGKRSG